VGLADEPLFRIDADMSGVSFTDNLAGTGGEIELPAGIARRPVELARAANGLLYPVAEGVSTVGAPRDLRVLSHDEVGVPWYPKPSNEEIFGASGIVTKVSPGEDALFAAVERANSGDVLLLDPGEYVVDKAIPLDKAITIRGVPDADGNGAVILLARPSLVDLQEGGSLQLQGLVVDGTLAPDSTGMSVIRTGANPIRSNMVIELSDVTVRNLDVNASYNVVTLGKNALADRIEIRNSRFQDVTGMIVSAAAETEDYGQYNVEYLEIVGNSFENVGGPVAVVYRGGTDESTFGPSVTILENRMENVGTRVAGGHSGALHLHGVQTTRIERNTFGRSGPVRIVHTVGVPSTELIDNIFVQTPAPAFEERNFDGAPRVASEGNTLDGRAM
jgi:poly(beta-D-mannuronate) lyase